MIPPHTVKITVRTFQEWSLRTNTIYIGRDMSYAAPGATESKWHNPYTVKEHGRKQCLVLYERHLRNSPHLINSLPELEGKEMGCWCKPLTCHGDIMEKLFKEFVKKKVCHMLFLPTLHRKGKYSHGPKYHEISPIPQISDNFRTI
jgi:hypothetical protein